MYVVSSSSEDILTYLLYINKLNHLILVFKFFLIVVNILICLFFFKNSTYNQKVFI